MMKKVEEMAKQEEKNKLDQLNYNPFDIFSAHASSFLISGRNIIRNASDLNSWKQLLMRPIIDRNR